MEKLAELKPSWYDRFQCKGSSCVYNCCQGWEIAMSRDEYRKWRKKKVVKKEQWNQTIEFIPDDKKTDTHYAKITLGMDNRCPLLTNEGLCHVQGKYGYDMLSNTCQVYPRQTHRYIDRIESSMSLGCEKVLELLLEEKEGVLLVNEIRSISPDFRYGSRYGRDHIKHFPILKNYYDIQTLCIILLQLEEVTMEERLLLLGMALKHIDELNAQGNNESISIYIEQFLHELENSDLPGLLEEVSADNPLSAYYSVLTGLTYSKGDDYYSKVLEHICQRLHIDIKNDTSNSISSTPTFEIEVDAYRKCRDQFKEWIKGKEYFLENILVSYLFFGNIPFKDISKSLWENYLYLIWVYSMIKVSLGAYLEEDSTDEDMIHCCSVLFRRLGHNQGLFNKVIEDFNNYGNSLAHLAVLLKSC